MTHTPGPWHFHCEEGRRAGCIYDREDSEWALFRVIASDRVIPEDKRKSPYFTINAQDIANARLAAAAPELLSALEFVLSDLNTTLDPEAALIIRAAIAKAKGGQA